MFGLLDYLKMGAGIAAGLFIYHVYALAIGYPSAAREARSGYVLLQEKLAAEALANEYLRQIILAQQIREQADREAEQLDIEAQQRREADEKVIKEDAGNTGAVVGADDLDWLKRVRKPR